LELKHKWESRCCEHYTKVAELDAAYQGENRVHEFKTKREKKKSKKKILLN